ncbi:MAG: SIR2 family protein [Sphingomonas sp.]|uniref:SIR2 family protein n=1 Tax=Sphingomonas sp. TaxID=28214 RepID=UPI0026254B0F|nr:SIR2 family protein [Sphingomonas sp.]MDK2770358.1 SIR2 family protein [Sphingomonas sp.]
MFVVGAGVSVAAGLPLFGRLAELAYERLGQAIPGKPDSLATQAEIDALAAGQYDRLIGLLERRLVYRGSDWQQPRNDVRNAITELVKPKRGASFAAHLDLLDISRGTNGVPRIVTTNFDTIFERAWYRATKQRLPSSACQGMPAVGSPEFAGAFHLHGRVADKLLNLSQTDLILTSPNFGEAYMRDGWASRTVYDLMRRYTLVLVGYSADDPPMRYMLEATEEGRLNFPDLRPAYALVADDKDDAGGLREMWRGKGVHPLIFPVRNHDYSPLYRTLREWADMVRDPLGWSEAKIAEITATDHAASSESQRERLLYINSAILSAAVVAAHADDPAWLEALESEREPLDDWSYRAWFAERLSSARAARYAVALQGQISTRVARAVDILLRFRSDPLPEPYATFWPLFVEARLRPETNPYGRRRMTAAVSASSVAEMVAAVEPRLTVGKRFRFQEAEEPLAPPQTIHDLGQFEFRADERDWQRRLEKWPQTSQAEVRLIEALDRALVEALETAADAGLLEHNGDLQSWDIALVHAPEPGDSFAEPDDRHRRGWRRNPPDQYNNHFGPLIRLMTGLWRRLAERDARLAGRIAENWAGRDAMIFRRLAAWSATISKAGPAEAIERYLGSTTRDRYWSGDDNPELVRFYCRRWNRLHPRTRDRIEAAILAGMKAETVRRFTDAGYRKRTRAYYTVRELVRIGTAGGRLSANARSRLAGFRKVYPDLPKEVAILAHLVNASYSGSGYSADTRVLAQVPDEELIASAAEAEKSDRIGQSDVWQVLVRDDPGRAFRALLADQGKGQFEAHRWQPLLSQYSYQDPAQNPPPLPDLAKVIAAVIVGPDDALRTMAYTLVNVIERRAGSPKKRVFSAILRLWDRLTPLAAEIEEDDDKPRALSEVILSHPLANLASALVQMQGSVPRTEGGGFAVRFRGRFKLLASLVGRPGVIARAAMIRELAFLHWLAPQWVDRYLFPLLEAGGEDAIDLMSVVSVSDAPQYSPLFNRLKRSIFLALEHDKTDGAARERLSGAVVSAAFSVIRKEGGFQLTAVECRHALTRMPNAVLASMAWELCTILRQIDGESERAATWKTVFRQFLTDYWPNDVAARTAEVSDDLAKLPGLAGSAFEEAVEIVLGLIRPAKFYDLRHGLELDEASDPIATYPRASLRLIASVVDRESPPPTDLGVVMRDLLAADPGIASEPAFWRMRQLQRPN